MGWETLVDLSPAIVAFAAIGGLWHTKREAHNAEIAWRARLDEKMTALPKLAEKLEGVDLKKMQADLQDVRERVANIEGPMKPKDFVRQ